jgi:hypothetical protein
MLEGQVSRKVSPSLGFLEFGDGLGKVSQRLIQSIQI